MTSLLAMSFGTATRLTAGTVLLIWRPTTRRELPIWRRLRVASVRRWLTRRRGVMEPLHSETTIRFARRDLYWHLVLTALFTYQMGMALANGGAWWRPLVLVLLVPCFAYFVGSLVQRQKIAIIRARSAKTAPER